MTTVTEIELRSSQEAQRDDGNGSEMHGCLPRVVLVSTDLTAGSAEAVRQGHRVAQRHRARLAVLYVGRSSVGGNPLFPELTIQQQDTDDSRRSADLERLRRSVSILTGRESAQQVSLQVAYGEPAREILWHAQLASADLLVLGDSGKRKLGRFLMGRTSTQVVRRATVPVLIARAHSTTGVTLAATDYSDPALPALRTAAAFTDGSLLLLHNVDEPPAYAGAGILADVTPPALRNKTTLLRALERLRADAKRIGAPHAEAHVTAGPDAAGEILAAAHDSAADLIVVGTKGRGALGRLVFGSVAERVVHSASCSVLVVRLGAADV